MKTFLLSILTMLLRVIFRSNDPLNVTIISDDQPTKAVFISNLLQAMMLKMQSLEKRVASIEASRELELKIERNRSELN